jgi:putative transposase
LPLNAYSYDGCYIIESETKNILAICISKERNMFVAAEHFLSVVVNEQNQYPVSTARVVHDPPQACRFLKINHHVHSSHEKSIIEITIGTSNTEQ